MGSIADSEWRGVTPLTTAKRHVLEPTPEKTLSTQTCSNVRSIPRGHPDNGDFFPGENQKNVEAGLSLSDPGRPRDVQILGGCALFSFTA